VTIGLLGNTLPGIAKYLSEVVSFLHDGSRSYWFVLAIFNFLITQCDIPHVFFNFIFELNRAFS